MKIAVPRERERERSYSFYFIVKMFQARSAQLRLETKSLKVELFSLKHLKFLSSLFRFFLFSRRNTASISSGCLSIRKGGTRMADVRRPGDRMKRMGGGIYEELTSRLPACTTNNSSDGLRGNSGFIANPVHREIIIDDFTPTKYYLHVVIFHWFWFNLFPFGYFVFHIILDYILEKLDLILIIYS